MLRRRLTRTGKLFGFLRDCRRELFSDDFQAELESMYRDTGTGRDPVPPALLAMAILLQAYEGVSDAEAVELTVVDLRWQMVSIGWVARSPRSARARSPPFAHD